MGLLGRVGAAISNAFASGAKPAPVTKPSGGDGVYAWGGVLQNGERSAKMQGPSRWVTYTNALNYPIVATGTHYFTGLLAGTEWHVEPNELGGGDAERAVEIVEQGLLEAQMPRPWSAVVRKMAMYKLVGFALSEWIVKRRSDGMMVFADIQHRPQHTISGWDKPSEQEPWYAVAQSTAAGARWVIPRGRLFYCVDDTLTDSPDGVGRCRHIVELVRRLEVLEALEGHAFQTDLRGMPMGRAPLNELKELAIAKGCKTDDEVRAFVSSATQTIRDVLANSAKTPDKIPYILFDSEPFKGSDPNVFTGVMRWSFELLRGDTGALGDANTLITRLQLEIARVLGIEFAMVGGGDTAGTYGMHENKTSIFATNLQNTLTEIAAFATNDLARPLVALNGLDPETCTPKLVAQPISTDAVEMVCRSLAALAQAGLAPDDPAIPVIRKQLRLPPPNELSAAMAGVLGFGGRRGSPGGPPDPDAGEGDVPVDDLGTTDDAASAPRAA